MAGATGGRRQPFRSVAVVPALDDRIAEIAADPGRSWGFRDALLGLLAVPAVFAVTVALLSRPEARAWFAGRGSISA